MYLTERIPLSHIIPPLSLSIDTSTHYALIRSELEKQGQIIGNNDLWIAAHALALKTTLVTNNVSEFSRVQSLLIENWTI